MAKEYNELEQLVNDVTNIDTARMTLRWALERLNAIEKEKAELKKNLTIAEETGKGLEIKVRTLGEAFTSRSKTLDEKEDFYGKLEATMALLGEGKLDIQQLLKKEAKLDHLRKELEDEYQCKFEELDKSQGSLIERWNQRLLNVEEQYAKRLAEAQNKYDSLRSALEAEYQGRLGALEKSYQQKEKELVERIKLLETSVKSGEGRLEGRKKELEAEFIAKKNEIEENYVKLRGLLQTNLDDRTSSLEGEHAARVKSLEKNWNAERTRLLEESRIRDEQFKKAQEEMARFEGQFLAQQEKHHGELLEVRSKSEEAFRNRTAALEKEKAAYETAVKKLLAQLEQKESEWIAEKEKLHAEFSRRCAETEASMRGNGLSLEKDYAVLKEEFAQTLKAKEAELGGELKKARKEIEELSAGNRQAAERLLDKEAQFNREIVEVRAGYEKELNLRVKDLVEAQTAHLLEVVESAEKKNEEASAVILARDAEINRLNAETADRARRFEENRIRELDLKISEAVSRATDALGEKLCLAEAGMLKLQKDNMDEARAMQDSFQKEKERLLEDLSRRESCIEAGDLKIAQLENEMTRLRQDSAVELHGRLVEQEDKFKALIRDYQVRQAKTEKEMEDGSREALARATEALAEKLCFAEEGLVKLQKDNMDEARAMQDSFQKEKERLLEDLSRRESCIEAGDIKIAQLENKITADRESAAFELHGRLAEQEEKFKALIRESQARREKAEKELEDKSAETLNRVTESLGEKLYLAEEGLVKLQKNNMDEARAMQDSFQKEKERLLEDLSRRESCIEAGDVKIAQLENELMRYRADSSTVLHNNLNAQEDKFNALVRESQARREKLEKEAAARLEETKNAYEARLKELQAALGAREDLMRADGEAWSKKQRGLDAEYSGRALGQLAEQEDRFNACLRDYHARQQKLEKEAAARLEETRRTYEARLKELQDMLQSKEALMRESEESCHRKQLELDASQSALTADLLERERALAEKEKKLTGRNLDIEKEYSAKTVEIEKLRIELTRAVMDYKNRK